MAPDCSGDVVGSPSLAMWGAQLGMVLGRLAVVLAARSADSWVLSSCSLQQFHDKAAQTHCWRGGQPGRGLQHPNFSLNRFEMFADPGVSGAATGVKPESFRSALACPVS